VRSNGLVVAIDGPSGAGKSTAGRALAAHLSYTYIDTGAMYRALALKASRAGVSLDSEEALAALCRASSIQLTEGGRRVLLDTYDVTAEIRSREISRASSLVSVHPGVRVEMVARQRELGRDGGVVLDGRDIGTAVFPDAEVKFYVDANASERAQRRLAELRAGGTQVSFDAVEREVRERDYTDTHRAESPLVRAWDALEIDTTSLTPDEVVERMLAAVRAKEGKPLDLGRQAQLHLQGRRPYLDLLRTAALSSGLHRVARGEPGDRGVRSEEAIYLVLEGRGRFRMGDEEFAVEPGYLFAVPGKVEHGFHSVTEDLLLLLFRATPPAPVESRQ
jgi:CMP/dCMP kinase